MRMRPQLFAIIVATVAIALGPVVVQQVPYEMARWQLAAAVNAVELHEGDGLAQLRQARQWVGDELPSMRDYWIFRLRAAAHKAQVDLAASGTISEEVSSELALVAKEACEASQDNWWIVTLVSSEILQRSHFSAAAKMLVASRSEQSANNIIYLNQLAYARALAALDLDEALQDIDLALSKLSEPFWGFLDTRAWVLFQMGRPQEALVDINKAIKLREREQGWFLKLAEFFDFILNYFRPATGAESETKVLSEVEAGQELWGAGVVYYHRAKILESLGRTEEAEEDFQWLRSRRLPVDGSLF